MLLQESFPELSNLHVVWVLLMSIVASHLYQAHQTCNNPAELKTRQTAICIKSCFASLEKRFGPVPNSCTPIKKQNSIEIEQGVFLQESVIDQVTLPTIYLILFSFTTLIHFILLSKLQRFILSNECLSCF